MAYFLGIDVGTTLVKALVADEAGRVVEEAGVEYGYSQPHPGWAEQNAEDWWGCLKQVTRAVAGRLAEPPVALALSTHGDTMVPVDADNHPLLPARLWLDNRTAAQVARLVDQVPQQQWLEVTGSRLAAYAAAASLAWWADERPAIFARAARFCLVQDYLTARLTGRHLADAPNASRTLIFDLHTRDWCEALLAAVGVERERLPVAAESGTPVGNLTREAAGELGLPPETLVVLGAHDQTAAAIGCGAVKPGTVMLSTGTAWVVLGAADELHIDPGGRLQTYCHAMPGGIAILGAYAGGSLLRWARDNFSQLADADAADYDTIVAEAQAAEQAGRGPLVFLPHFYGSGPPLRRTYALGALTGLQLQHTRADIYLALLRGVATQTAAALATMAEMGYDIGEVRMIGGGAQSDFWAQLVADAHGAPLELPVVSEAAAYGAAMLAAIGSGHLASAEQVAERVAIRKQIVPRPQASAVAPEWHTRYLEALDGTWQALAGYRAEYR